ncbi:hypothetical protein BW107_20860 [Salmonella enterica]|nr:hypothetical protein [Salmonella enterica]
MLQVYIEPKIKQPMVIICTQSYEEATDTLHALRQGIYNIWIWDKRQKSVFLCLTIAIKWSYHQ